MSSIGSLNAAPPADSIFFDDFDGTDIDWSKWQWFQGWGQNAQDGPATWDAPYCYNVSGSVLDMLVAPVVDAWDWTMGLIGTQTFDPRGRTITARLNLSWMFSLPEWGEFGNWAGDRLVGWARPSGTWDVYGYGFGDMDSARICPVFDWSWNYDYPTDALADAAWHVVSMTIAEHDQTMTLYNQDGSLQTDSWLTHPVTITVDGQPLLPGRRTPWNWAGAALETDIDSSIEWFGDALFAPLIVLENTIQTSQSARLMVDWIAVS